jgi:transposase
MSGVSKIEIRESIDSLKALLNEQKSSETFQKIQVLYLLKNQQVKTITEAATIVGKHRVTVQKWLGCYQKEGIEGLLQQKTRGGRKSAISEMAVVKLKEKLQANSEPINYQEIQHWLETEFDLKVSYDVVYYLIRKKLKLLKLFKG